MAPTRGDTWPSTTWVCGVTARIARLCRTPPTLASNQETATTSSLPAMTGLASQRRVHVLLLCTRILTAYEKFQHYRMRNVTLSTTVLMGAMSIVHRSSPSRTATNFQTLTAFGCKLTIPLVNSNGASKTVSELRDQNCFNTIRITFPRDFQRISLKLNRTARTRGLGNAVLTRQTNTATSYSFSELGRRAMTSAPRIREFGHLTIRYVYYLS